MITVSDKLDNMDLVVEDIKKQPQTYSTILKDQVLNATFQFKLRRKVSNLCKQGIIFKTTIPGTRFGQVLLYCEPRPYKMLVETGRMGVNVYYFLEYEQISKFYIKVKKCCKLNNCEWTECVEEKEFFEGNILKFI